MHLQQVEVANSRTVLIPWRKNLTMHNMAFEVFPTGNTWPDIRHHRLELTFTSYCSPKVLGSGSANLVRSQYIYQRNTHVVTNNTQLPVKRDEGCCFQCIRISKVSSAVNTLTLGISCFIIYPEFTSIFAVQSLELPVQGSTRIPPTCKHSIINRIPWYLTISISPNNI